ncbi:MAG: hypothetical protein HEP70_09505 [Rhodobiaceae bacterium]|nr:hypothetical protein [Rhodobiaceae bacterium]
MASRTSVAPETLEGLIQKGTDLWVYCSSCQHNGVVSAKTLLNRIGNTAIPNVGRRFRCPECGATPAFCRPHHEYKPLMVDGGRTL